MNTLRYANWIQLQLLRYSLLFPSARRLGYKGVALVIHMVLNYWIIDLFGFGIFRFISHYFHGVWSLCTRSTFMYIHILLLLVTRLLPAFINCRSKEISCYESHQLLNRKGQRYHVSHSLLVSGFNRILWLWWIKISRRLVMRPPLVCSCVFQSHFFTNMILFFKLFIYINFMIIIYGCY